MRKGLKLEDDSGYADNFEELGYQSEYSIILLGNLYIALLMIILGLILLPLTKSLSNKEWINKQRQKVKDALIWNGTIGFFNESYIVICLSCFVNILSAK